MNAEIQDRGPSMAARRLAPLFLMALVACGGGGGDSPAPPAADPLPTIAPAVALDDNHQVGVAFWANGNTATGGQGQTVEGVPCAPLVETYHIHSHLSIIVDGQARAIPAQLGIVDNGTTDCHYQLHTHDLSGKLHVEGPAPATYTLGQMFAIWGQPLATDNVAGITGKPIVFYITENGTVTRFTGDPKTIELTSHRHIAIQIGTAIAQVPFFTWSAL